MSDIQKLIAGIILVAAGLVMVLSAGGIFPVFGIIIGLAGAVVVIYVLLRGKL